MTDSTDGYTPHPHIGGRATVLRALTAWRAAGPGAPRVVVLTGSTGSGCSRVLTGFLMLCDPEFRKRLPLDEFDPSTVPPDLPAPAVPSPEGLTAAQFLWSIAEHFGLTATRTQDVWAQLASLDGPVTVVVPDVDRAGVIRATDEPARLVREVLGPLAATENVRLLVDVPRHLAAELVGGLPEGTAQVVDLDHPHWADPDGLALQAETALDPSFGAPRLPFTVDPAARRSLAASVARRAGGSRLTVHLAVQGLLMRPEGFDPADESLLPSGIGESLDLHARRLGADPQSLRQMLAPLALAEGVGLPLELWGPLANATAGRDMSADIAGGMLLVGPFVQPVEEADAPEGRTGDGAGRTLLRLVHPGVAEEIRAGLPDLPAAQTRIAMALLEAVPDQDWGRADPYVRDFIAGHTLEAGLLPQLLTDPGLFSHADPVQLRAAVEAVPLDAIGAPARTYLRTAPLLTRTQAPADLRAALLETAFVEDGLPEYAAAVHDLGLALPWRTLWNVPVPGVSAVTVGSLLAPAPDGGSSRAASGGGAPVEAPTDAAAQQVAVLVVAEGTPGARPAGEGIAVLVHDLARPGYVDADPRHIQRPGEQERVSAPLALSRGADYLRVWERGTGQVVAALVTDTPLAGADLSSHGVLVYATGRGVTALQIRPTA